MDLHNASRGFILAVAVMGSPAAAQVTTDCITMSLYTSCQTYGLPQQPSAADVMIQNMLRPQPGPSIMDVINARNAEREARAAERAEQ
jgi:hypothetical protein